VIGIGTMPGLVWSDLVWLAVNNREGIKSNQETTRKGEKKGKKGKKGKEH